MREYRISEVRTSGCTAEEEEGGEEGGGRWEDIYTTSKYIQKNAHDEKRWSGTAQIGREGRERRLLESMPRRPRCRGLGGRQGNDDYSMYNITARVMGEHNLMQMV